MKKRWKTRTRGTRKQVGKPFPVRGSKRDLPKIKPTVRRRKGIDPKIHLSLKLLNKLGFRTIGSCQGHWYKDGWEKPWATFGLKGDKINELKELLKSFPTRITIVPKKVRGATPFLKKGETGYHVEFDAKNAKERNILFKELEKHLANTWQSVLDYEDEKAHSEMDTIGIKIGKLQDKYKTQRRLEKYGYVIIIPTKPLFLTIAAWLRNKKTILFNKADWEKLSDDTKNRIIHHEIAEREKFLELKGKQKLSAKQELKIFKVAHEYAHKKVPFSKKMKEMFT